MKFLVMGLFALMIMKDSYKIDFGQETLTEKWMIVNDDVMGGRSTSEARLTEDAVRFTGNVSLENNGGFASMRGPWQQMDLSKYSEVSLRFKGTSREFALTMDTSQAWYKPNYKQMFVPSEEEWTEITIPLKEFKEYSVGRATGKYISEENLENIIRLGIILFDKQSGPFELELDYIEFR